MYRYDIQLLSYHLSILFFVVSLAKIFIKYKNKQTNALWIYVLHGIGWSMSIVYYYFVLELETSFSGHEWSPVVRVLQYISFGSWMLFTLVEDIWENYIKDKSLAKNFSKRMGQLWTRLTTWL